MKIGQNSPGSNSHSLEHHQKNSQATESSGKQQESTEIHELPTKPLKSILKSGRRNSRSRNMAKDSGIRIQESLEKTVDSRKLDSEDIMQDCRILMIDSDGGQRASDSDEGQKAKDSGKRRKARDSDGGQRASDSDKG